MRVTSKGQVTIPYEMRRQLGITPDTEVDWELVDGVLTLRMNPESRKRLADQIIAHMRGRATSGLTTDEILAMTRGED